MKVYREPNVWIEVTTDSFAFEGPSMDLRPIYFGTIFQVEVKTALGSYSNASGLTGSYPDLKTDADVDTDSAKLYIVHTDTGEEYDVTDGLVSGGVEPTFGASTVTVPALMYDEMIDSTTGVRVTTGDEFSDSAEDFTDLRYGDKLILTDNNDETLEVNQVDADDNIELVVQYAKNIIYYDALVAGQEFAVGDIVVGAAAQAEVMYNYEDSENSLGYLLLGVITGTDFVDGEDLDVLTVKIAESNGVQALIGTAKRLAYTGLTAPGAISIGDTLGGAVASGDVLYIEVYNATDGFALLNMAVAGFVDGEALDVGAGAIGEADGVERDITGYVGLIDSPSILYYDGIVAGKSFTAGETIEDGTTGATAPILYAFVNAAGTSGYLYLGTIIPGAVGPTFNDGNDIEVATIKIAEANGQPAKAEVDQVLYFDNLSVAGGTPIGDEITGGTSNAMGTVLYSEDNGSEGFALLHMGDSATKFSDGETLTATAGGGTADADGANADISITVSRSYEIRRYIEGIAYISYRAARADLDGSVYYISKYEDVLDLAETEEAMIPENPLPYAGKLCTDLNSDCFLVPVQDLESYQDSTDSTNSSAWTRAFLLARDLETPYAYVVLTQNNTVRALMEVAINWKRDPDNYMNEAVGYFSMARVTEDITIAERTAVGGAIDANTWQDAGISDFLAYGCRVGKTLELIDTAGEVTGGALGQAYKFVTNNVTATSLTTVTAMTSEQQLIKDYRYIDDYYTYDQEATAYAIYGDAIQNKAIRLIYPPTCLFDNVEVPSYYLGVIRAAQLNINKPAVIYTKSLTPFVERVVSPFNKTQLNTVASGGITVYYQENTDIGVGSTPVMCRDAITTDRSSAVNEEEVVVTEVDYCTRYIRGVFYPEMGKYHNDEMLDDGISFLAGKCQSHLVTGIKCVVSLELESYAVDEDEVRKTIYDWSLEPRVPNKWADMTIHVVV